MNLTLHIWRQRNANSEGQMVTYQARDISPDMSFLEMLDVVNEDLIKKGEEPIAFDNDCREGICGACGLVINGVAHGGFQGTTACQVHMRKFKDGDEIYIEPWRVGAFPVIRDLVVNRTAFDRIIQAGGYVSVSTGGAPDGNALPVPKTEAETAMDAAACISCGACARRVRTPRPCCSSPRKWRTSPICRRVRRSTAGVPLRCSISMISKDSALAPTISNARPSVPRRLASNSSPC